MEKQYYQSELEDLHVGYICQILDPDYQGQSDGNEWRDYIMETINTASAIESWKFFKDYRTKYLTQEDIESLGFVPMHIPDVWTERDDIVPGFSSGEDLQESHLIYDFDTHILRVYTSQMYNNYSGNWTADILFKGECKSINELETVLKLLKIK